jgi:hypothetical protein
MGFPVPPPITYQPPPDLDYARKRAAWEFLKQAAAPLPPVGNNTFAGLGTGAWGTTAPTPIAFGSATSTFGGGGPAWGAQSYDQGASATLGLRAPLSRAQLEQAWRFLKTGYMLLPSPYKWAAKFIVKEGLMRGAEWAYRRIQEAHDDGRLVLPPLDAPVVGGPFVGGPIIAPPWENPFPAPAWKNPFPKPGFPWSPK